MSRYSLRRLAWAGPLSTVVALAVDLLYISISRAFGEQYLLPLNASPSSSFISMPVMLPVIVITTSGLVATAFFALLLRFARKPVVIFLSVAITALILSFGGSFSLPSASMRTKLLLSGMHVLAGAIITAGIILLSRYKRTPSTAHPGALSPE